MEKLIKGIGINDKSIRATVAGKLTKEYSLWINMLSRVNDKNYHLKYPTYSSCTISETFKYYHLFYNWCINQIGYNQDNFVLDKDLLVKGNKHYSENTCTFIPLVINNVIITRISCRGELPIGVSLHQGKYVARCKTNGKLKHIGVFTTIDSAFNAYKEFKESYIKELAELYKEHIDIRAYRALISYTVDLDD
jgi:hypothetical protein